LRPYLRKKKARIRGRVLSKNFLRILMAKGISNALAMGTSKLTVEIEEHSPSKRSKRLIRLT